MNMTKQEWKLLLNNKILLISVIAITFIPVLYATIFGKSVWDPYGETKHLPVAVVNEDQPVSLMGQELNIGDQVIDNLKKNHQLDWHFVTKSQAEEGLKDLDYYMVVSIPSDFSKNAASVIQDEPKQMEIIYTTNGSLNYIAETISSIAATALEDQVRTQVVEAYTTAVAEAGKKLIAGVGEAASGSKQLSDGTTELQQGLKKYTEGVSEADGGAKKLADGTGELAGSIGPLVSGVNQLSSGANQLSSALVKVDQGLHPLQLQLGMIDAGLLQLSNGAQELSIALNLFESNLSAQTQRDLIAELENIQTNLTQLITNAGELRGLGQEAALVADLANKSSQNLSNVSNNIHYVDQTFNSTIRQILRKNQIDPNEHPGLVGDIAEAMQDALQRQLEFIQQQVNQDLALVEADLNTLSQWSADLAQHAQQSESIANGMANASGEMRLAISSIQSGIGDLNQVMQQFPGANHANNLSQGLAETSVDLRKASLALPMVFKDVDALAQGSQQLSAGLKEMQGKLPELTSGVTQLNQGTQELEKGLNELVSNSPSVMTGIDALNSGAKELSSALGSGASEASNVKLTKKTIDQFADPVTLKQKQYSVVSNYGEALSPYIMSLALFVGCMLFNFIYPIRKVSMQGQPSGAWWLSKVVMGFAVSSMMAFLQATIMLLIGLPVDNLGQYYLTAFSAAWCYMAIVMFLAMTFDNPGRFVAMILLVLQLGGAGGTFPPQIQPRFFGLIHPYLPMSYSVYAFRNAISGGIGTGMYIKSIIILLVIAVISTALLRVSMSVLQKNYLQNVSRLNNNQALHALELAD